MTVFAAPFRSENASRGTTGVSLTTRMTKMKAKKTTTNLRTRSRKGMKVKVCLVSTRVEVIRSNQL